MTQDLPSERLFARQTGQAATGQKRRYPDDSVVPPIISSSLLPEIQSRSEYRAVEPRGKLLDSTKNRLSLDESRHRLNDSGPRVDFHQTYQRRNRATCHNAVRIQHDHVPMPMPPPPAKICNIPALPIHGKFAAAVMYFAKAIGLTADIRPTQFLFDGLRWIC